MKRRSVLPPSGSRHTARPTSRRDWDADVLPLDEVVPAKTYAHELGVAKQQRTVTRLRIGWAGRRRDPVLRTIRRAPDFEEAAMQHETVVTSDPFLQQFLEYQHPHLVRRLQEKLNLPAAEAIVLFEDTKRFLYLCGTRTGPFVPPPRIDQ